MIRIQSTNRGIALVGAGYFYGIRNDEELAQSGPLITGHYTGNDRQFDLWAAMATYGRAANSMLDTTATAATSGWTEVEVQRLANMVAQQVIAGSKFPSQFTYQEK